MTRQVNAPHQLGKFLRYVLAAVTRPTGRSLSLQDALDRTETLAGLLSGWALTRSELRGEILDLLVLFSSEGAFGPGDIEIHLTKRDACTCCNTVSIPDPDLHFFRQVILPGASPLPDVLQF